MDARRSPISKYKRTNGQRRGVAYQVQGAIAKRRFGFAGPIGAGKLVFMKAAEVIPQVGDGQQWPLSVAAYRTLGEAGLIPANTELLYGFVYKKVSKSPLHSALVRRLLKLLREMKLSGCSISTEQPISFGNSEPEPDIAIIRGGEEDFWENHPKTAELVIEVCVTSHDFDRSKLPAYAAAGVKECWLVLGPGKQIEVHREPKDRTYRRTEICGPGGSLTSIAVPECVIRLEEMFAR